MRQTTLIVPGFHGSGEAHWQSWLQQRLAGAERVGGIDWEQPVLAHWAAAVRSAIDRAAGPVWLVGHSFGGLASVVAAADRPDKVAGVLLVAPADPERFTPLGPKPEHAAFGEPTGVGSVAPLLPRQALAMPGVVVASTNDPWAKFSVSAYWANRWGCRLISAGAAGHLNVDSGHGPWPEGLALLQAMQEADHQMPLGDIGERISPAIRGRCGALAQLRHQTRRCIERLPDARTEHRGAGKGP